MHICRFLGENVVFDTIWEGENQPTEKEIIDAAAAANAASTAK